MIDNAGTDAVTVELTFYLNDLQASVEVPASSHHVFDVNADRSRDVVEIAVMFPDGRREAHTFLMSDHSSGLISSYVYNVGLANSYRVLSRSYSRQ